MKKNLNEQVYRIKSMMGLIKEQGQDDSFMSSLKNCRGISWVPTISSPTGGFDARVINKIEKDMKKELESELKNFNKLNNSNLDIEYYTVLKDDQRKVNNWNDGRYNDIFDENGKVFTKNLTQQMVNKIQVGILKPLSSWFLFWKEIFGDKTPSIKDLYNYIENIGGKEKLKELVDSDYNIDEYRNKLKESIDVFNNNLKQKFPFENPSGKTNFYIMWYENKLPKFRYFNTYEEWKLSTDAVKQEGNIPSSGPTWNENATEGSMVFSMKPTKGAATQQLFK